MNLNFIIFLFYFLYLIELFIIRNNKKNICLGSRFYFQINIKYTLLNKFYIFY
jgi:hypothetical protein